MHYNISIDFSVKPDSYYKTKKIINKFCNSINKFVLDDIQETEKLFVDEDEMFFIDEDLYEEVPF